MSYNVIISTTIKPVVLILVPIYSAFTNFVLILLLVGSSNMSILMLQIYLVFSKLRRNKIDRLCLISSCCIIVYMYIYQSSIIPYTYVILLLSFFTDFFWNTFDRFFYTNYAVFNELFRNK